MHARNMKHFSAAIFMDVEKACDKVWPAGLFLHFCAVKMTIQVESTNSDLQRGLDRRLRHTTLNRTS